MASSQADSSLTCEAVLFEKGPLGNGWSFKSVELTGATPVQKSAPKAGAKEIKMIVQVSASGPEPSSFFLKTLTLTGRKCKDWAKAFE